MANGDLNTDNLGLGADTTATTPDQKTGTETKTFSVEEIPELSGLQVGDELTLKIVNISEDGASYDVDILPAQGSTPAGTPDLSGQFV